MLISMKMMKDNPQMMATAQKLMSNMTPEEMLAQSKAAQEKMSSMSKEELEEAAEVSNLYPPERKHPCYANMNQHYKTTYLDGEETDGKDQSRYG